MKQKPLKVFNRIFGESGRVNGATLFLFHRCRPICWSFPAFSVFRFLATAILWVWIHNLLSCFHCMSTSLTKCTDTTSTVSFLKAVHGLIYAFNTSKLNHSNPLLRNLPIPHSLQVSVHPILCFLCLTLCQVLFNHQLLSSLIYLVSNLTISWF